MGLWNKLFGAFSARGKATSLYKQGMQKAEQRDMEGAIVAYTAVVEMKSAPADVKAMALFNRALAYSRSKDEARAERDLKLVLSMDATPSKIKTAAKERMKRMEFIRQRQQQEGQAP